MAAIPTALQIKAQGLSRNEQADDIARLKIELNLPNLDYVDISAQLELTRAVQRWPFLSEFGFAAEPADAPPLPIAGAVRQGKFGTST